MTSKTAFVWIAVGLILSAFVLWGTCNMGERRGRKDAFRDIVSETMRGPIRFHVISFEDSLEFVVGEPTMIAAIEGENDSLRTELAETKTALSRCRSGYKVILDMEE